MPAIRLRDPKFIFFFFLFRRFSVFCLAGQPSARPGWEGGLTVWLVCCPSLLPSPVPGVVEPGPFWFNFCREYTFHVLQSYRTGCCWMRTSPTDYSMYEVSAWVLFSVSHPYPSFRHTLCLQHLVLLGPQEGSLLFLVSTPLKALGLSFLSSLRLLSILWFISKIYC